MKQLDDVSEQELLDECGFWRKFSGEDRRAAHSRVIRWYWVVRSLATALYLRFVYRGPPPQPLPTEPCDVMLLYVTENQRRAFLPWIGTNPRIQTASCMAGADWQLSWRRCGSLSLRYFAAIHRLLRPRSDHALTFPWFQEFLRYEVGKVLARELFARAKPRVVVVSNDHSGFFRGIMREARRYRHRLVYTQHASIGRHFPPLDFDLSMLDGTQAYLRYRESGKPRGSIVISGRLRTRGSAEPRPAAAALRVGLATNLDDALLEWVPVVFRARRHVCDVVLRCHPAETRRLGWAMLCRIFGVRMDGGTLEGFLQGCSVLISGLSGIILDAAVHGVPALIKMSSLRHSDEMTDYYGYEKFGLCRRIRDARALSELITTAAATPVDFECVGAFEAGLVQEPAQEKRRLLELYVRSLDEGRSFAAALRDQYVPIEHDGVTLFATPAYAALNAKHGWLRGDDA